MNPASSSSLDPKLKEVYDRVMGTSVGSSTSKPQTTSPAPLQTQNNVNKVMSPPPNGIAGSRPVELPAQPSTATHSQPTPSAQSVNRTVPPPRPASLAGAPQPKSAVDYAALAAKYATPLTPPTQETPPPPPPAQKHAAVTPSSTMYGVVNGGSDSKTETKVDPEPEQKGGALKKIMLIAGILMFFVIYTFVWVVVFGFELPF